ncbi:MAG: hypothetical protein JEY97_03835 [Bacteroidales bacterium]|nr:hypothetical protein [Bacteroidales bacterium]
MKKTILLAFLIIMFASVAFSQVAINETGADPDPSAILDLSSTDKGFLVPRVSTAERNAIGTTQSGLLVYDIDTESFWYYNNMIAAWVEMSGGGADNDWVVLGDNMYSTVSGNVGIGTNSPNTPFEVVGSYWENIVKIHDNSYNGNALFFSSGPNWASICGSTGSRLDIVIEHLSGEIGIGRHNPSAKLDVNGSIRMTDGNEAAGRVMMSNALGVASWADLSTTPDNDWTISGDNIYSSVSGNVGIGTSNPSSKLHVRNGNLSLISQYEDAYIKLLSDEEEDMTPAYIWSENAKGFSVGSTAGTPQLLVNAYSGNVGIGTITPEAKLEVAGQIKITGGNPGTGKVMTSDINGLGSWENIPLGVQEIDDLNDAKTDGYSLFLGSSSGVNDDGGNYNTSAGQFSFNHNISGIRNAVFGTYSLFENESGNANTAIGYAALYSNETGNSNVALGIRSLYKNTDRSNLVAIGDSALFNNGLNASMQSHGTRNTALGSKAMYSNTIGRSNIALGYESMKSNIEGSLNTAVGCSSLNDNTEGDNNTALGYISAFSNISGDNNIALGSMSLYSNETGSNNLAIGRHAGFNTLGSGNIFVGHEAGLYEEGSNKLYISNSSTDTPLIYGDFSSNILSINGDVAIGTTFASGYKLSVDGKIICEELRVDMQEDWPDYVFKKDYKLMPLDEVEEFINENGHLPNIPSASEMSNSGLEIGETQRLLMEKIEELTLYIIEQQKLIDQLIEKTK